MATPRISQNEVWLLSESGFRQTPRLRRLNPQVPQLSGPPFGIGEPPRQTDAPALYQKFDCSGNRSAYNLLPREQFVIQRRNSTPLTRAAGARPSAIF